MMAGVTESHFDMRQMIYDKLGEFALMPDPSLSIVYVTTWFEIVAMLAASESHCAIYSSGQGCWTIDDKPRFVRTSTRSTEWKEDRPACVRMHHPGSTDMRYMASINQEQSSA
jgi:hypothetical protein